MEEQTRLAKEQVESLLEDRRIKTEEALAQRQRDEERITALTDKWVCIFSCSLLFYYHRTTYTMPYFMLVTCERNIWICFSSFWNYTYHFE